MKRLRRIVICFLLGVVTTVSVACLLADLTDPMQAAPEFVRDMDHPWTVLVCRRTGSLAITAMISHRSAGPVSLDDHRVPQWSRMRNLAAYQEGDPMPMIYDFAYGWPMLSMRFSVDAERDWQTGTVLARTSSGAFSDYEYPLRLLGTGFAIDTAFYGAIWFVLLTGPRMVRRYVRRLRGRCLVCGYDLRGEFSSGCSECGWRREETS